MQLGRHQLNAFELGAGFVSAVVGDMTCATVFDTVTVEQPFFIDDLTCVSLLSLESASEITDMTVSSVLDAIGDAILVGDLTCSGLLDAISSRVDFGDLTGVTVLDDVEVFGTADDMTCVGVLDALARAYGNRNLKINLTAVQPGVEFSTANSGDIDYG